MSNKMIILTFHFIGIVMPYNDSWSYVLQLCIIGFTVIWFTRAGIPSLHVIVQKVHLSTFTVFFKIFLSTTCFFSFISDDSPL